MRIWTQNNWVVLLAAPRCAVLLAAAASLSGCYYHVMAGPALATADAPRVGAVVTASSGINGERGGFGLNVGGTFVQQQYTGMAGVEGFRIWRGESQTGVQPYVRGALGVFELGVDHANLVWGGLSPRAEAGLMWLGAQLSGMTLSIAGEYRLRGQGPSTPILWLQVGFGDFDFVDSAADRRGATGSP